MKNTRKFFIAAVCGVLVGGGGILLVRQAGHEAGERVKARLALVWPNLMQMPEYDRAFVAGLATACKLDARPLVRSEVIACLKEAASDKNGSFPVGLDQSSAPGKLDQMQNIANND